MEKVLAILFVLVFNHLVIAQMPACPCCQEPYRQFDFWLGDWETTSNDQIAGTNKIVLLQDSCLIQENWTSATGAYSGTSYNFYDPQDGNWHQTWVDNQGQCLRLSGNLVGKSMILKSDPMKNQQGDSVIHRITWTPNENGSVRQLWESTKINEDDWQTVFDGLYKRKPK